MDPLNKQDRKEATLKMLAFFLLALVVVAIPMYFAFKMPEKEAAWNEAEYKDLFERMNRFEQFAYDFMNKTDSALVLYKAYQNENDDVGRDKIRLRYSGVTNQMEDNLQRIEDDSVMVSLFDNVVFTYNNLFRAWSEKNQVQKELDKCQQKSQSQSQALSKKNEIISEQLEKVEEEESKSLQEKEIDLIKKALEKHNGSKSRAAKELGTTERKLRKRMKELGI